MGKGALRRMFPVNRAGGLDGFLARNFFTASTSRLLASCIPLSLGVFLAQNVLEILIGWATGPWVPSRLQQIQLSQAGSSWVSPLLLAPLIENTCCLVLTRALSPASGGGRWRVPIIVAAIAAVFHVVAYREIVYASIFVNFLAFCVLIHNVEGGRRGFWASVLVHSLTNLLVLLQLRSMLAGP